MSFADQITRLPRPFDADRGADALEAAPWAHGPVADLLVGTGGCSPYLLTLLEKECQWLQGALDDHDAAIPALFAELKETPPDQLGFALRQAKRRVALLIALGDLGGVWPLETVTGHLTDFADLAATLALRAAIANEIRRGKLPGQTEDDVKTAGGMVALAMGKMGAGELNYSSDIDLICLFDETRFDPDDYHDARASFVRATRKMSGMLNDLTGDGYVFRTDLRLRPDPSVTPVCLAMETAERYYESLGRTWERAAYIKARAAIGDIAAGERFLKTLKPFVWRKHLDFAAIQDAHDMVQRIREHKGLGGRISLPGHNMKLGRGGIREIEFFTQTRQIIAGGRDPELRVRGTVEGLSVLARKDWVPDNVADTLIRHYRAHREVEHRIQMVRDAQTHALPNDAEGFDRLACFVGTDSEQLKKELSERLEEVHALTEGFLAAEGTGSAPKPALQSEIEESDTVSRWRTYPALRSQRANEIFDRLRPEILSRLGSASNPDEALAAFDGFLQGLPAGVQVFSMFEANPHLIDLLVDIVSVSPDLGRYLSRNSGVFDAVLAGDFFAEWPGPSALQQEIAGLLADEPDYERKLDTARRWAKEWFFRIGVHLLRGLSDADEAGAHYADLADSVLAALLPEVTAEFARKHGEAPGRGAVVLGMGSLGARRLHSRSDLDLIVIYDPQDAEYSDGRRPLAVRTYYARLTQALITAITAPMSEGRLFEVDMRLRPSGNQGPVATSLISFRDYQKNSAWVWEHLALTRARPVAGPADLAEDIATFRTELLSEPRDRSEILQEVATMRARIAQAKGAGDPWDPKLGQGRMQDIELIAQACALLSGQASARVNEALWQGAECGWLAENDAAQLVKTYQLCARLQMGLRLVTDGVPDLSDGQSALAEFLCRLTEQTDLDALLAQLTEDTALAASIIEARLPEPREVTT